MTGWTPKIWHADELQQETFAKPRWVVERIIPEGLSVLIGGKSLGKSWVAYDSSLSVATGTKALGELNTDKGDVLYLALEDSDARVQERLNAVLAGTPAPHNLSVTTEWPNEDGGGLGYLESWLTDHAGTARLVVVDMLVLFRGKRNPKADSYQEDYETGRRIRQLAITHHVAIVVVHHTNRNARAEDWMDRVSGTTGIAGPADRVMYLDRKRGEDRAWLRFDGRVGQAGSIPMAWDADRCRWLANSSSVLEKLEVSPPARVLSPEREEILDVIRACGRPLSPADIAPIVDKSANAVRQLLLGMKRDRDVVSLPGGGYFLPGVTPLRQNNGNNGNGNNGLALDLSIPILNNGNRVTDSEHASVTALPLPSVIHTNTQEQRA